MVHKEAEALEQFNSLHIITRKPTAIDTTYTEPECVTAVVAVSVLGCIVLLNVIFYVIYRRLISRYFTSNMTIIVKSSTNKPALERAFSNGSERRTISIRGSETDVCRFTKQSKVLERKSSCHTIRTVSVPNFNN